MRVPLKTVSKAKFQASSFASLARSWSCYMQSVFLIFLRKNKAQLEQNVLIRNQFQADITKVRPIFFGTNEEQLIVAIISKRTFSESSLSFLWLDAATVYSELSKIALSMLLPFSTTYIVPA